MSEIIPSIQTPGNKTNRKSKKIKKNLPNLMLPCDFFARGRNRRFVQQTGADGFVILTVIWIASAQEHNGKLAKDEIYYLTYPLIYKTDTINDVIKYALECGLLQEDEHYYFNTDIQEDKEHFNIKQGNYSTAAQDREEEKRKQEQSIIEKQDCTKIVPESWQDSGRIILSMNMNSEHEYDPDHVSIPKGSPPDDVTRSSTVQNKTPKQKFGEHVYLTQTEIDNYQNKFGTEFLDRCCEKLNAWIEQDPTAKRVKNGKNAGATFRAWVFNAVAEEQMRATRSPQQKAPYEKETNFERNLRNILEG